MTCFEWFNQSSDYLDGILVGSLKEEADQHLLHCPSCGERLDHFRLILSSISNQPRSTLPIPIRKSPFSAALPKLDRTKIHRVHWDRIPWYLRTAIEASGIVLTIVIGISIVPRIRTLYEKKAENSLNDFANSFSIEELKNDSQGDGTPRPAGVGPLTTSGKTSSQSPPGSDEFSGESENEESEELAVGSDDKGLRAGTSEIWRFNLKSDSPGEVLPKIVKILKDLKISEDPASINGIEAPGGVQFDLLVPQSTVVKLKNQLQKIAPAAPAELSDSPIGETFTWYKNKSKRKIPPGQTRVVIWLSQI